MIIERRVGSDHLREHLADFELEARVRYKGDDGVNHIFSLEGPDGTKFLVYSSDVYEVTEEGEPVQEEPYALDLR